MLHVHITRLDGTKSEIEVEAPVERVEQEIDAVCRKYRQELQIPGFRKGKAPLRLIRARFRTAIESEVLNDLVPRLYEEAQEQERLIPLSQAEIKDVDYKPGKHLRFVASVDLPPEIVVTHYEDLKATKPLRRAHEEDVDAWLERLRERHAEIQTVHREAGPGDVLLVDMQRLDSSGVPIVGEKVEDRLIQLSGENEPQDEVDRQMIGIRENEERRITLSYPRDQGTPLEDVYLVKVKQIQEKKLPALDDEFAKDVGDYGTLQELREVLRERLQRQMDHLSQQEMRTDLLNQLMDQNPFDAPEIMIQNYLDAAVERARREAKGNIDEQAIRERERGGVIRQIKSYLILEAIAKSEGIQVADEEIEEKLRGIAEQNGVPFEELLSSAKENGTWNQMRSDMLQDKIWAILEERNQIEEVEMDGHHAPLVVPASVVEDMEKETADMKKEVEEEIQLI